jgi:hypothetical protein
MAFSSIGAAGRRVLAQESNPHAIRKCLKSKEIHFWRKRPSARSNGTAAVTPGSSRGNPAISLAPAPVTP